jgi:2-amino-4-hydroxy-6-hydroxymethyldihydropteridine diphosphokinase
MSTKPSPSRIDPPIHAVTAYIALGANLGDRDANLRAALSALESPPWINLFRVSRFLENPAVGGPLGSPPFLNAAVELRTILSPIELLHRLLEIERVLGRSRREKWEPRIIDLDLLLYADQIIATEELTVPHPLMHQRIFVLQPLMEIAPDLVHPLLGKEIHELAAFV